MIVIDWPTLKVLVELEVAVEKRNQPSRPHEPRQLATKKFGRGFLVNWAAGP